MDIEAVIAEAQTSAPEGKATEVAPPVEAPQPEATEKPVEATKPDAELTPEQQAKREANRRSHQNSREAKLKREVRELRELVLKAVPQPQQTTPQAPQQPAQQPVNDGRPVKPNPDNYHDWDVLQADTEKYYENLTEWMAGKIISEREAKNTEQTQAQAQQAQIAARVAEIGKKTQEFGKEHPEYFQLVDEHSDFFDNMPPHVEQALLETENTQLAVLTLMKEGNLEALESMTPAQVIREIAKAEIRGEQYLNQNKTTNAPAPMQAARGTGNPGKALHEQSVEELLKRFN